MEDREKTYNEWILQSDYDLETASHLLDTHRNVYCIFMCHLCLEKALKSLYINYLDQIPPKIHSLLYFVDKLNIEMKEENLLFISKMDDLSIITRYPEDLRKMISLFSDVYTKDILNQTKLIQQWIKELLI
ncbi:MAG: HEPN domain-containing protein [Tannerella sp.]|jgi:HEPN domain-containing protein|nr:HEPN domain-containing protein [Tannerella sp.]